VHSSTFRISILGNQLGTLARIILAVFSSEYEELAVCRGLDISEAVGGCDGKDFPKAEEIGVKRAVIEILGEGTGSGNVLYRQLSGCLATVGVKFGP